MLLLWPVLRAAASWVVLLNTDFPDNLPGGNACTVTAENASHCADVCLGQPNCAAIAWNGPPHGNQCCNFKCDDKTYKEPHPGQQGIIVRKGGRFCPPPPPAPCPAGQTCWHRWPADTPPPDAAPSPFEPSETLSRVEWSDTVSIPAGVGGDTWYVSSINKTHLFASWTDGALCSQGGHDKGLCYRAAGFPTPSEAQAERKGTNDTSLPWCPSQPTKSPAKSCKQMPWKGYRTGYGVLSYTSPNDDGLEPVVSIANLGTVQANAVPYEGRYPSGLLSYKGLLLYGTYALAVPANPGDVQNNVSQGGCGNWCAQGPWWGFRHSVDGGRSFIEPRVTGKDGRDNIFAEVLEPTGDTRPYPFGSDTWVGHVKFGAAQVVDMGIDLEHSPDGKLYLIGHGSTVPGASAWMQGSSVYMARCLPTVEAVNDRAQWEFYSHSDSDSASSNAAAWTKGDVAAAKPLFVWPNRTGVATMSYLQPLKKWLMVVGTPQHGNSMVGSFDTYFLESDTLTGPFRMVSYWQAFGPQAYFVGLPTAFAAKSLSTTATVAGDDHKERPGAGVVAGQQTLEVSLSYSANFHPAGPPNPPGRTGGWNIRKARLVLKTDEAGAFDAQKLPAEAALESFRLGPMHAGPVGYSCTSGMDQPAAPNLQFIPGLNTSVQCKQACTANEHCVSFVVADCTANSSWLSQCGGPKPCDVPKGQVDCWLKSATGTSTHSGCRQICINNRTPLAPASSFICHNRTCIPGVGHVSYTDPRCFGQCK